MKLLNGEKENTIHFMVNNLEVFFSNLIQTNIKITLQVG